MRKTIFSKIPFLLLAVFLLLDTGYTLVQHITKELDGDVVPIVLFEGQYQELKDAPFGFKAISNHQKYGGVNRYFVHWYLSNYLKLVPLELQKVVSPVDSIYVAAGLSKLAVHIVLLVLLAFMVSGAKRIWDKSFLIAASLLAPLFQSAGHFYKYIGIVDQSIVYSSFYALPLALLLLFLKPYHDLCLRRKIRLKNWMIIGLFSLAIILPFSGPLVPGVVLVLTLLFTMYLSWSIFKKNHSAWFYEIPKSLQVLFGIILLLSVYSIFLGQYNIENPDASAISMAGRFQRLPTGLYYQLTQKLAFPLLFLMIAVAVFLHKKSNTFRKYMQPLLIWFGLFALTYLLLLPFGGFREYRPNIIRKDTFLPVTLALVYLYAYASYLILTNPAVKFRNYYLALVLLFSLIFTIADEPEFDHYSCQKGKLTQISTTTSSVTKLDTDCTILYWTPLTRPDNSKDHARLFQYWNLTDQKRLFYQE